MERPKEMRVTKREAKAMLVTGGWREDPELTRVAGGPAFSNVRGRLMNASTLAGSIRIALQTRTCRSSPRAQSP